MKVVYLFLMAILLASCATPPVTQDRSVWNSFAYKGFGSKIERLAGEGAEHCGVINLGGKSNLTKEVVTVKQGQSCIAKNIAEGQPFKYGTVRIPIDSYLFEAVVYTPTKEYWIVHYDVMLDGTDNMHVIKRCKQIDLARSDSIFEGTDCVEVSTQEWLSDIPEQQQ